MRAPRRISHADQYAVPHPSSITNLPATGGIALSSRSGMRQTPHVSSSRAHARIPAPRYSTLIASHAVRFLATCSPLAGFIRAHLLTAALGWGPQEGSGMSRSITLPNADGTLAPYA